MRKTLLTMLLTLGLCLSVQLRGAQADDAAVQEVIRAQIEAFEADDFEAAFGYASPLIKDMFGSAESFGVMVRQGYPMVWRPSQLTFGESRAQGSSVLQRVLVRDSKGNLFTLRYEMVLLDGRWQINAVSLLKDDAVAV